MAKNNNLTDFVTDIADAIRAKCKTTGTINPQDFSKFVGGMPFFKFRDKIEITAPDNNVNFLPLRYRNIYIKGYVYLTNDNGATSIDPELGTAIVYGEGYSEEVLFNLQNTAERIQISGFPEVMAADYAACFSNDNNGTDLIAAGWHMWVDIFELCIGNPDGENTKLDLNNAMGGGV